MHFDIQGLKARGNVEDWLGKVEEAMFASLRRFSKKAKGDYEQMKLVPWILCNASQVRGQFSVGM